MSYELYVYEHCPYCIKARMIFGLKDVPVTVRYLLNDDEKTPNALIGRKMVPILKKPDGTAMPESMDIVHYIDREHGQPIVMEPTNNIALHEWLEQAKPVIYRLAMPRWVKANPPLPEFETPRAIAYFSEKKEAMLGESFHKLLARSQDFLPVMNKHLAQLETIIQSPNGVHGRLSEDDFHLFALLHSISIVKGLVYPPRVEEYRQQMSRASGVALLSDRML